MKRFYRSRTLLRGLDLPSAIRCIRALADLKREVAPRDFEIRYKKFGVACRAAVRGRHMQSDLQSILELAAGDCYRLGEFAWTPDVIIDGGGNSGLFSLAATARWPRSAVHCYEPMPENRALIKRQLEVNGLQSRVSLVGSALGGSDRKARFFVREANQGSLDSDLEFGAAIEVDVARLWRVYEQVRRSAVLIKLDVEGAEFEILNDFFQHAPVRGIVFVLEVHGNREQQDNLLKRARAAQLHGGYWERGQSTGHLFLASDDVSFSLPGLTG